MDKIIQSALAILKETELLTLSTVDKNQPCSCSAYFAFDEEFNLYIWTDPSTLHSKNIAESPLVSVNIVDTTQQWGTNLKGLQIFGKASVVSDEELKTAGKLYLERFPGVSKFVKKVEDFHAEEFESKIYKIQIKKIKVFDEATFGKEEFRELVIKR